MSSFLLSEIVRFSIFSLSGYTCFFTPLTHVVNLCCTFGKICVFLAFLPFIYPTDSVCLQISLNQSTKCIKNVLCVTWYCSGCQYQHDWLSEKIESEVIYDGGTLRHSHCDHLQHSGQRASWNICTVFNGLPSVIEITRLPFSRMADHPLTVYLTAFVVIYRSLMLFRSLAFCVLPCESKTTAPFYFCNNFVKARSTLIVFGRRIPQ